MSPWHETSARGQSQYRRLPAGADRQDLRRVSSSRLWEANALDFDDIILHTVRLLQQDEEVLELLPEEVPLRPHRRVPGHQPPAVPAGVDLLAGGQENICVVGDDDQSIYRFRGATIENILNFEKQYPRARRSSGWSRTTAPPRTSWTPPTPSSPTTRAARARRSGRENGAGDKVRLYTAHATRADEANYRGRRQIMARLQQGRQLQGQRRPLPDERPVQRSWK